jgi:hypothetical protein
MRGITTTRQYSIAVMLMLMVMLAMVAVATLGIFASPASAQDPDECPEGTVQVAESDADNLTHSDL